MKSYIYNNKKALKVIILILIFNISKNPAIYSNNTTSSSGTTIIHSEAKSVQIPSTELEKTSKNLRKKTKKSKTRKELTESSKQLIKRLKEGKESENIELELTKQKFTEELEKFKDKIKKMAQVTKNKKTFELNILFELKAFKQEWDKKLEALNITKTQKTNLFYNKLKDLIYYIICNIQMSDDTKKKLILLF